MAPQSSSSNKSPSQSWSAYILSTYSSSISPTYDPDQYAPSATPISSPSSTSPTTMTSSSSSSRSPWGPYIKAGRGGAGNFTWQSPTQSPTTPSQTDPELGLTQQSSLSDRQRAAAEAEAREQADTLASKQKAEFTHMGRGGAGNYNPSAETAPPEVAPEVAPAPPAPTVTVDPYLAARSGYYGRGGAGNHSSSMEAAAKAEREAEESRRRREEEVRARVEGIVLVEMRRPEGAVTREGKERERNVVERAA